jgi:ABC-type transport system substrate-binding protein
VAKSFYQGLFGLDKEMKLQNVLAESYTVSPDGWCIPSSCIRGEVPGRHRL